MNEKEVVETNETVETERMDEKKSFNPIMTQEEYNNRIGYRLNKQKNELERLRHEEVGNLTSKHEKECSTLHTTIERLEEKLKSYEGIDIKIADYEKKIHNYELNEIKRNIVDEYHLPRELMSRLQGEDEETLRHDAQSLVDVFNSTRPSAPLKSTEEASEDEKTKAYKALVKNI